MQASTGTGARGPAKTSSPIVRVDGVLVRGGGPGRGQAALRKAAAALAALAVVAASIITTGILSSCSGSVAALISAEGGARIALSLDLPPELAKKLRKLGRQPADRALFDLSAIRRAAAGKKSVSLAALSAPGPDSLRAEFLVPDLAALAASPELADGRILGFDRGTEASELSLRLERGRTRGLLALFPGLDPGLVEALAPPALGDNDLSPAEYREMLAGLLGTKALAELDAAAVELRLTAPSPILAANGGKISGQSLVARVPLLELLVLEKPLALSLSWRAK